MNEKLILLTCLIYLEVLITPKYNDPVSGDKFCIDTVQDEVSWVRSCLEGATLYLLLAYYYLCDVIKIFAITFWWYYLSKLSNKFQPLLGPLSILGPYPAGLSLTFQIKLDHFYNFPPFGYQFNVKVKQF